MIAPKELTMAKTKRKLISQPEPYWAAFEAAAKREGLTLSAWIGEAGKAQLSKSKAAKLPDRLKPGRKQDVKKTS